MSYKVGDSIRVKSGVKIPDCSVDASHWQGRISGIDEYGFLTIDWDSHTLKVMPTSYIKESIREGCGWEQVCLDPEDIEPCSARDTPEETRRVFTELEHQFFWSDLGEAGDRIQAIVAQSDPSNEDSSFEAWHFFLKRHLIFPFEATVTEWQESNTGPQSGDSVQVDAMSKAYDGYGLYVKIFYKNQQYWFPLSDLEVNDTTTENNMAVHDYVLWFSNR